MNIKLELHSIYIGHAFFEVLYNLVYIILNVLNSYLVYRKYIMRQNSYNKYFANSVVYSPRNLFLFIENEILTKMSFDSLIRVYFRRMWCIFI